MSRSGHRLIAGRQWSVVGKDQTTTFEVGEGVELMGFLRGNGRLR